MSTLQTSFNDSSDAQRDALQQLYNTQLLPKLRDMESIRVATRNWLCVVILSVVVAVITSPVVTFFVLDTSLAIGWSTFGVGMLIALSAGGLGGYRAFQAWTQYREMFKARVVSEIAKLIDPNLEYYPHKHVTWDHFSASQLARKTVTDLSGEDAFVGCRGNVDFVFSELWASHTREYYDYKENKQKKERTTLFNGIFFHADFHKRTMAKTFVFSDQAEKWLGKQMGQYLQSEETNNIDHRWGDLVKLEDPEFEREFCVYASDQIEARYVLTPDMMRRLLLLKHRFDRNLSLSFVDSRVYIGVAYRANLFEPKIFRTGLDFEHVERFYTLVDHMLKIVDDLNLNTRIWTGAKA